MKPSNLVPFIASIISIIPTACSLATYSTISGGPSYSVGIASNISVDLLSGSGIVDGNMVANVRCTSCSSKLSSTTSTSSNWIAAWNSGSALDTTDTSTSINQHSGSNHRQFTFDLSQAQLSSDSNPFTSTSAATTSSSPSPGSSSSSSSSASSGSSPVQSYDKAHGIIMGMTVVLLFPLGALSMRIFGRPWLHATLQMFSFIFLIVGLGLGIKLAELKYGSFDESTLNTRTIIYEVTKRQFGGFGSSGFPAGTFTGTPPWATATSVYTGGFKSSYSNIRSWIIELWTCGDYRRSGDTKFGHNYYEYNAYDIWHHISGFILHPTLHWSHTPLEIHENSPKRNLWLGSFMVWQDINRSRCD
ncbi:hypothetical protein EYC84_011658 [Monilinia fructicola]|uniref:Uncharacterized protein n=1 Tax=Monilinia fructicola TaxID=38448 RepID=A0A5M9J8R3_MONFR|nr:hypothetical protein EYC84_011658 [Monilinia fructicola]